MDSLELKYRQSLMEWELRECAEVAMLMLNGSKEYKDEYLISTGNLTPRPKDKIVFNVEPPMY